MILLHPTYFPSIVQMVAVAQSETIVFEVEDNYQKQTYRNRAYIAHANGRLALNVPVKHNKSKERHMMKEVVVDNSFPWQSQHWKSIQTAYRTSPFFEFYEDELRELFTEPVNQLLAHNLLIFRKLAEMIGLDSEYVTSTEYFREPSQKDLRFLVAAKTERIFELETYNQVLQEHHGFLPNLSVLDLLFNEGPNTLTYLENQQFLL
jgi:WbqC-like protein family